MNVTPKIERAIRKASVIHDGQRRRGGDNPPYVSHLFSVAAIVSTYTGDENTIVAALLHDALEDTAYGREELSRDFGADVLAIVEGVTEERVRGGAPVPWRERKEGYLENLRRAPEGSLYVSAADKIHNLSSLIEEYRVAGEALWDIFPGGAEDHLWFFGGVLDVLHARLSGGIVDAFEAVYTEATKTFERHDI